MVDYYVDASVPSSNVNDDPGKNGGGGVTIDVLTMALLISSVLYVFCLILAKRKISLMNRLTRDLQNQPKLTTKKLLILSVALVSVVRIMTFWGVAAMNVANVRAHYSLQPPHSEHGNQLFYDKAMTVLFDLPNVMVVSTFLILALVFSECFVEARLHTESATSLKKSWLISFMVLNTALYVVQLILYGLIFLAPPSKVFRTIIYVGITGINFTAVLLVLIFYVYLNIRFSVSYLLLILDFRFWLFFLLHVPAPMDTHPSFVSLGLLNFRVSRTDLIDYVETCLEFHL